MTPITVAHLSATPVDGITDIYIGRGTPFGNYAAKEIEVDERTRERAIAAFGETLKNPPYALSKAIKNLALRVVAGESIRLLCHCKPLPCHGDLLAAEIERAVRGVEGERVE